MNTGKTRSILFLKIKANYRRINILLSTELSSYRESALPIANRKMFLQDTLSLTLSLDIT
jgi:hypothetical protein